MSVHNVSEKMRQGSLYDLRSEVDVEGQVHHSIAYAILHLPELVYTWQAVGVPELCNQCNEVIA